MPLNNSQTQQFVDFLIANAPPDPTDIKQFLTAQIAAFQNQPNPPIIEQEEGFVYYLEVSITDGEHQYPQSVYFFCPKTVSDDDYAYAIACTYLDSDVGQQWTGIPFNQSDSTFEFSNGEYRLVEYEWHSQEDSTQIKDQDWIRFDRSRLEHYYRVSGQLTQHDYQS
ncbi:hypothetical protein ACQ4M3_08110 [Leptolyngbya sp. AN03gr2]|uniref:hypothetical protein n=1 Tax=unclassified Leptolyngbya TaxID=2650499 RepID=UPI003D318635